MTLLDRGLGFRIDAETTVADEDILATTEQFCAANSRRFRYGICDFTAVKDIQLGANGLNPAMRIFLKIVEACPDMLLAVAGPSIKFKVLERYAPLFQELPWISHRCDSVEEAMDWVSENMKLRYGMFPDYVRTIPLSQAFQRD